MAPLLLYLVEASLCLSFLYLIYLIFLREDTFHRLKRFYLLTSLVLSLIIPILPSPASFENATQQILVPAKVSNVNNQQFSDPFEKIVVTSLPNDAPAYTEPEKISFTGIFFLIYFLVSGILIYRLIMNYRQVYYLMKRNPGKKYGKYRIINLPESYPSFSFFRYIFLNDHSNESILKHELTHAKQKHSFDLIFIELYKVFFWFNPLVWFYKTSLSQVHECLADKPAIKTTNIEEYQTLLLSTYLSNYKIELAHSFNYSLIKFRIKMMTKIKSKWWAKYKVAFVFPAVLLSLMAFSNQRAHFSILKFSDYFLPKTWYKAGSTPQQYSVGSDTKIFQHGKKSAFLESNVKKPDGFVTLMQDCNLVTFKGKRVKMTGYIKTEGVNDTSTMWARVDDYENKITADFDNMWGRQQIGGTKNWTKCEIIFDVPTTTCSLFYGFILTGKGKAWFDNVSFEVVNKNIPKTAVNEKYQLPEEYIKQELIKYKREKSPANLDFEE